MMRVKMCAALLVAAAAVGSAGAQPVGSGAATITLTPAERAALLPVKQAVDARNWTLAASLAPAARSATRSPNARYVLARLQLEIANATQNAAGQEEAVRALLETRKPGTQEQAELLRQYAALAYESGNIRNAEGALNRALQLVPDDPDTLTMLAQVYRLKPDVDQSVSTFLRAVRLSAASGRSMSEARYKVALAYAEQTGRREAALEIARNLIAAYPTAANWRDVLIVFRTVGTVDPGQQLDAWRLMRASGALTGERDYMAAANAFVQAGLPAEAKAVIDEGVARRHVTASDSAPRALLTAANTRIAAERRALTGQIAQARAATGTAAQARSVADTLLAHGRHAEAAELYRLAATRTGEDPGLLATRLGIALALAGQRTEGAAAFGGATGPRGELASLWSIWLSRRPG